MITFHDPRGEVASAATPYELSHQFAEQGQGTTVALLANGFPDSDNFLNEVGNALKELMPNIELKFWNKGNASIPAPESMLQEIKAQCQIAIAAYGH